jgi:hypothetical protein
MKGGTYMPDEEIIFEGKIPFKIVHFSHGTRWLLLFGWNIGLIISWFQTFNKAIKITSQRVVLTSGVISQDIEEIEFYRVRDTKYRQQGILQRLFGIGTITLFSEDATAPTFTFAIHNPEYYREQIRGCVNMERKRMRTVQFD